MSKKNIVAILLLSMIMIGNDFFRETEASAETTTNGQVTFEGGSINIDPSKPVNPDDPSKGNTLLLPTQLNFGSTPISYVTDMQLKATTDGNQSSKEVTGAIRIDDKRGTGAGWSVKVNQTQFKNGDKELAGAELSIITGEVMNTGGMSPTGGKINQKAILIPGAEMEVFKANAGEGNGISELPLKQFDLRIPAATAKSVGQYTTTITWTVSETI